MRKICKECGRPTPKGKNLVSLACRYLGYCCYHYYMCYPERKMWDLPPLRQGSERLLSPDELRNILRYQFEGMEQLLWDEDFQDEWVDYLHHIETEGDDICDD